MSSEILESEAGQNLVKGERKFLHDISNQLVVAQGMGGFILKALKKREDSSEKEIERMEKSLNAIKNMVEMVQSRRQILHELSSDKQPKIDETD